MNFVFRADSSRSLYTTIIFSYCFALSWSFFRTNCFRNKRTHCLSLPSSLSSPSIVTNQKTSKLHTSTMSMISNAIHFDNKNLKILPVDHDKNRTSRQVRNAIFSRIHPEPVLNPRTVAYSESTLRLLGISSIPSDSDIAQYFSGNKLFDGSDPASHCYAGHQFGSFAGQLGDGTVIYLGEAINSDGERWELQLKGAGRTPYSRSSDGRKVLRSSIREFLASEAMYTLHIPTTRAAACVTSDTTVERDPLYNGKVIAEQCTIVARVAPNFFRFGSFEIFKEAETTYSRPGPSAGNFDLKKTLLDHILTYFPPSIFENNSHSSNNSDNNNAINKTEQYKSFFAEVVRRTANLVAQWQAVGWVHGVLNTDNMSIMGLTIDYGPYAFLEAYDEDFTPNGSDGSARYAYGRQPEICKWNLQMLAEALVPLIPISESIYILESIYQDQYDKTYNDYMANKFGLRIDYNRNILNQDQGKRLLESFREVMSVTHADYTDTFQAFNLLFEDLIELSQGKGSIDSCKAIVIDRIVSRCANPTEAAEAIRRKMRISKLSMPPKELQQIWQLLQQDEKEVKNMFSGADIKDIRVEIENEKKKLDALMISAGKLEEYSNMDYNMKQSEDRKKWKLWIDEYFHILQQDDVLKDISVLSNRLQIMRNINPTFILRNWVMQDAIDAATKKRNGEEDYSRVRLLLEMASNPYDRKYCSYLQPRSPSELLSEDHSSIHKKDSLIRKYCQSAPAWAPGLVCTCSS